MSARPPETPHDPARGAVAAALLLGGASSRMGRDKAHVRVGGAPAAERLARLLEAHCDELLLVGGDPPPGAPGRRVADPPGPRCALRGVVGALEASRREQVLVVATDLLALTPDLLRALAARAGTADAVVPRAGGRLHPLCALYRRDTVLPRARRRLEEGRLSLHALLAELEVRRLEGPALAEADPTGRALVNVNTPEELERLRAELPDASEGERKRGASPARSEPEASGGRAPGQDGS